MGLEIKTAQELYDKGEIDALEYQDFNLFWNRRIMQFSGEAESLKFATEFVHKYLIPTYGKAEAAKFPLVKTGPASEDLFAEEIGIAPKKSRQVWFTIPEDRFYEIEKFLGTYNSE